MIFKSLQVTNIGVFLGQHTFDLTCKGSCNIVLIGGKNGAGKSTLFEAIRLCLYGAKTGEPTTQSGYATYLNKKIHTNPHLLLQPSFAAVTLVIEVSEQGQVRTYEMTRSWNRNNGTLSSETFELTRDGITVDEIDGQHWEEFVQDLVPRGIADLFFFDGERIQRLAHDASDTTELNDAIKALLGLHLVEQLHADLNIYLAKVTRQARQRDPHDRTAKIQAELRAVAKEREAAAATEQDAHASVKALRETINRIATQLTAEGGTFAKDRASLTQRQATLTALIQRDEDTIREAAAGLLPFAVVPELCLNLQTTLAAEETALQSAAGDARVVSAKEQLLEAIHDPDLLDAVPDLSERTRTGLTAALDSVITRTLTPTLGESTVVHDLSPAQRARIYDWIRDATERVPPTLHAVAKRLDEEYRELHRIERRLKQAPAEATIAPIIAQLQEQHEHLQEAMRRAQEIQHQLRALKARQERLAREYAAELDSIAAVDATRATTQLVPRLRKVLDEYQSALLNRKTRQLAQEATRCFKSLSRKKDRLDSIEIAPDDLTVSLRDHKKRLIEKAQLSAGEKQVYAVAMLWALARTSGRPLPVIIDTPMARLDSDHRSLFLNDYLPAASHQVIILSTDTEVDAPAFTALKPHIARAYHLSYDEGDGITHVQPGYFW